MGSRIKKNPDKTFYWCFQASCPIARDKDPDILFQFPEEFSDEESVRSLPRFCFPYDTERVKDNVAVQHFTFVLTDLEGCQRFGFCRLTSSTQSCLCILSYLPWFEVFYKLLNNLSEYTIRGQYDEMKELLSLLYKHPVPPSSGSITLQMGGKLVIGRESPGYTPKGAESERIPYFIAPDPKALASIPESRNLTELVVAVDVGNLLKLFASLLFERRVLIYCSKLSTLTACVHACNVLLFPMYWQHIFIPVLPPHLLDYCCAPMPYLIGIHSSLLEPVRSQALEDVVMLNVDTNTVDSPYDDLKKIPADVVEGLKVRLKRQTAQAGTGVARVFLQAQALLFGGYRDALQSPDGGPVVFCEELFIKHKSQSIRQFLEDAVHLQCFKEFIDGRLEMLNCGEEPDDIFEEEVEQCRSSAGGTKLCRQWVGNLKKGGGALILTWKSTANKATKIHCKLGLKTLLSPKSRPRRPARKHPSSNTALQKTSGTQDDTSVCENSFLDSPKPLSASGHLQEEDQLSAEVGEMDLLGEIFETLNTQSSHEGALLYGTRSLDLFGADSMDYISHKPSQESLSPSFGHRGSLVSWEEGLEEGSRDLEDHGLLIYGMKHDEIQRSMEKLGKGLQSDNENLENASLDLDGGVQMEEFRVCLENETKTKAKKAECHIEEQLKMEDEVTNIFNEDQLQSSLDETAASTDTSDEALRLEEQNKTESDLFPILNVTHTAGVFQFGSGQVSCVDTSSGSQNAGVPQTSHSVGAAFSKPRSELKNRSLVETGSEEQDHVCRKVSELKKMFEN